MPGTWARELGAWGCVVISADSDEQRGHGVRGTRLGDRSSEGWVVSGRFFPSLDLSVPICQMGN